MVNFGRVGFRMVSGEFSEVNLSFAKVSFCYNIEILMKERRLEEN